ncbi:MAG: Penicillin-insensitive murein endopeptidase [Hyphomicrobiaceae bacterium hypho_1]
MRSFYLGMIIFFILVSHPVWARPLLPSPKPSAMDLRVTKSSHLRATDLFRIPQIAASLQPAALGSYTRGCLAGAQKLEESGPSWQAMRLSRNRYWAHPLTVRLVKKLAVSAKTNDGWNGLLVGDLSMPRGGPMWPSHNSHQNGLDVDIWLIPMPNRRLSKKEREKFPAKQLITKDHLSVDHTIWTNSHSKLIKRAASFKEVQRVLVHPAIKRELCRTAGSDKAWLSKVRPVRGHYFHFHIRLRCPPGSNECKPQKEPEAKDGCGAEIDRWYAWLRARLKLKLRKFETENTSKRKRHWITMHELPASCKTVLKVP